MFVNILAPIGIIAKRTIILTLNLIPRQRVQFSILFFSRPNRRQNNTVDNVTSGTFQYRVRLHLSALSRHPDQVSFNNAIHQNDFRIRSRAILDISRMVHKMNGGNQTA